MKTSICMLIKAVIFFNLICTGAWGANATFIAIFDHQPQTAELEYAVEVRQADGRWVEVAKGPSSPLTFTASNVSFGQNITARVFVRAFDVTAKPLPRNQAADTSNEASATVTPAAPVFIRIEQQRPVKSPTTQ